MHAAVPAVDMCQSTPEHMCSHVLCIVWSVSGSAHPNLSASTFDSQRRNKRCGLLGDQQVFRHGLSRAWQLWYSGVPMKFAQVCQVGSRWFTMARPWANGPSWPKKFCKKGRRLWQDWAIDRDQTMGVRHEGLLEGNGGSDCSHRLLPGCSLVLGRFTTTNCG